MNQNLEVFSIIREKEGYIDVERDTIHPLYPHIKLSFTLIGLNKDEKIIHIIWC
jgi:hypothetical protein